MLHMPHFFLLSACGSGNALQRTHGMHFAEGMKGIEMKKAG
jgi:hypothetical protein